MGVVHKDDYRTHTETDRYCKAKLRLLLPTDRNREVVEKLRMLRGYEIFVYSIEMICHDLTYISLVMKYYNEDHLIRFKDYLEQLPCTIEEETSVIISEGEVTDNLTEKLIRRW